MEGTRGGRYDALLRLDGDGDGDRDGPDRRGGGD
jgi:hypothetical protein